MIYHPPSKEYTVMEKPSMSTRREQIAEGVKYFIVCAALIWIVAGSLMYAVNADEFRFTIGDPQTCEGGDCSSIDENGRFSRNGDTIGQLNFLPSEEINRRTAIQNGINNAFRGQVVSLDQRLTGLDNRYTAFEQDVDRRFSNLGEKLAGGIAGSYAMNNIPTPPNNGLNLGGGVGLFDGQTAVALGAMGHTEKMYLKGGATVTEQGDLGGGFGIGWSFRSR